MNRTAEVVPLEDAPPPASLCERVAATLAGGELVAMPTETVYGIAARADLPAALEALRSAKADASDRPWTWHVGSEASCERLGRLSPVARRLMSRYWPGPLTLVLPIDAQAPKDLAAMGREGWIGIRFPAHRGTTGLLNAADFPVVLSSANRHGAAPATDADSIGAELGADLALILDGGPARIGEPSGVLRVGRGRFELLREGLLPISDLRHTAGRRIAFVCTGNTCRSPMAAALARRLLVERLELTPTTAINESAALAEFGFEIRSMGVFAAAGQPASNHAVELLAERQIDLSTHRSSPALTETIAECDEIYALTRSHRDALIAAMPPGRAAHVALLDPEGGDVADPIGGSLETYRRCAAQIEAMLRVRLESWA